MFGCWLRLLIFDSLSLSTPTYNLHLLAYARKNAYLHRGDKSRDESSKTAGCEQAMVNCLYSGTMLLTFSRKNGIYFKADKYLNYSHDFMFH